MIMMAVMKWSLSITEITKLKRWRWSLRWCHHESSHHVSDSLLAALTPLHSRDAGHLEGNIARPQLGHQPGLQLLYQRHSSVQHHALAHCLICCQQVSQSVHLLLVTHLTVFLHHLPCLPHLQLSSVLLWMTHCQSLDSVFFSSKVWSASTHVFTVRVSRYDWAPTGHQSVPTTTVQTPYSHCTPPLMLRWTPGIFKNKSSAFSWRNSAEGYSINNEQSSHHSSLKCVILWFCFRLLPDIWEIGV